MYIEITNLLSEGCLMARYAPELIAKQLGITPKEAENWLKKADKLWLTVKIGGMLYLSKQGKTLARLTSPEAKHIFLCRQAVRHGYGKRGFGIPPGHLNGYSETAFFRDYCWVKNLPISGGAHCFEQPFFAELLAEARAKFKNATPSYVASQIFDYISFESFARHGQIIEFEMLKKHFTGNGLVWFKRPNDGDLTF